MLTQQDFRHAQQAPTARHPFLSQLRRENPILGQVAVLQYEECVWGELKGVASVFTPMAASLEGHTKQKQLILLFPSSFEVPYMTWGNFQSMILDHQVQHATELYHDPQVWTRGVAIEGTELLVRITQAFPAFTHISLPSLYTKAAHSFLAAESRAYARQLSNAKSRGVSPSFYTHIYNAHAFFQAAAQRTAPIASHSTRSFTQMSLESLAQTVAY